MPNRSPKLVADLSFEKESAMNIQSSHPKKGHPVLLYVLPLVMTLFIGILVLVYFISTQANPIILDEKGKPVNAETSHH
jgi:hypothetical protein